jgi:hypothetical protein
MSRVGHRYTLRQSYPVPTFFLPILAQRQLTNLEMESSRRQVIHLDVPYRVHRNLPRSEALKQF